MAGILSRLKLPYILLIILGFSFRDLYSFIIYKSLPELKKLEKSITPTEFSLQQMVLLKYKKRVCEIFEPCAAATMLSNSSEVIKNCNSAYTELSILQIPEELPEEIKKYLGIYQQSLLNNTEITSVSWDKSVNPFKALKTKLTNWEVDTCSFESIPQKVYRFYKFDEVAKTKLVTCKEIDILSSSIHADRSSATVNP